MAKENDRSTPEVNLNQKVQSELSQAQRSLDEVNMMIEQSQRELDMLTQRNTAITTHLQQVQLQEDLMPLADIRAAYSAALDAQQRLLVLRGRMEKLQSDRTHLEKMVFVLKDVIQNLSSGSVKSDAVGQSTLDKMIEAQEAERERLSHQMHDGPAQTLSNFIIQAEIVSRTLEMNREEAKEELKKLKTSASKAFQDIRTFIFELRPMMLDDLGLVPTLRRYTASFQDQTGTEVNLSVQGEERRFKPTLEIVLFRAVQELMSNAAFHNAGQPVKVQIQVEVTIDVDTVRVRVSDNGKGFTYKESDIEANGSGLKLIRERVEMLGGSMKVVTSPARGCSVSLSLPID
ncbi:MAG: ATP-binding protein [Anaerolineaceae bacterium]|nr:ATP-binding protein [Anaerolineaceae bacterium]